MSVTFTKLFSSITESTIWCEDSDTRIVWVTMLAMADRKGRVWASIPGLANRARVPLEAAEKALGRFMSPDKYSRTPDYDGRRIEPIDGGWQLLNYEKYRAMRDEEERKAYQREWVRERRHTLSTVDQGLPQSPQAEAEADLSSNPNGLLVGRADDCPHQEIINLYHQTLPMCPSVRLWTGTRARNLRARWREDKDRQDIEWWKGYFEYVAESRFLTGRVTRGDKPSFVADLGWLVKSENLVKVYEGKYHRV